jgi:hypothetical protein
MLEVTERGRPIAFSFEDVLRYHGGHSPGGAAIAFKVLEAGLPALGRWERREIVIETAFGGPGARDAFELVTRAVTDGRYHVDPALARPDRGRVLERFVFRLSHPGAAVTLLLRPGFVDEEFVDLARADRDEAQEARLTVLKRALAERVMARPAGEVLELSRR